MSPAGGARLRNENACVRLCYIAGANTQHSQGFNQHAPVRSGWGRPELGGGGAGPDGGGTEPAGLGWAAAGLEDEGALLLRGLRPVGLHKVGSKPKYEWSMN